MKILIINLCIDKYAKKMYYNSIKRMLNYMLKMILVIVGTIIALCGTIMIFDARSLTKKLFSFGDQNEATSGLKILGFFLGIIGTLLIYFNI